jgi:hypothetical protein
MINANNQLRRGKLESARKTEPETHALIGFRAVHRLIRIGIQRMANLLREGGD